MPIRLLIAEDDEDLRTVFAKALRTGAFEVELACDGKEALEKLDLSLPDVLIVDIGLPLVSGLELVKHIRQLDPQRHTRIIVVSGNHLYDTLRDSGTVDLFLVKPVRPTDLVRLAERLTKNLQVSTPDQQGQADENGSEENKWLNKGGE